jgi:Kef-type K+ transport system membrane component KefB
MTSHQVQLLFLDLAAVLLLARVLGHLATRVRQPPVVGEILAGVLLGPTLFNGAISGALFPSDVRPLLSGIANVGVALFMFVVGLEVERSTLRGRGKVTAGAVIGSTAIPFALGLGLAVTVLRGHSTSHPTAFVVFIGLSVSVTAFPVLARILTDRGLSQTTLGGIALATAAAVDVIAWVALAGVQASVGGGDGQWRVALMVPYLLVMTLVVRPLLRRFLLAATRSGNVSPFTFAVVLVGGLLAAAATEAMGMHFIFGAFLFGMIMPREGAEVVRAGVRDQLGSLTAVLLPVYFVVSGLQVNLSGLTGNDFFQLLAILFVAMAGKIGGTYLGARSQRLPARPAFAFAALMNTRGLTELVILGVGLNLGLLDGPLYSLMVVMALVTTAMTGPLLALIYRKPVEVPGLAQFMAPEAMTRSR